MVRSRTKLINQCSVSTPATDEKLQVIRDSAMETHALVRAIAGELCETPAGTVPEWLEKLVTMNEHSSRRTLERVDEYQRHLE